MAAINFTPISLYYTTTAAAVPSAGNLVAGELALNTTDEKLYFKNAAGTVKLLASNAATAAGVDSFSAGTTGLTPSTATTGAVTLAGTLANTNGGTGATAAFTQYGLTYASSTTVLATTAAGTSTTVLHGNASGAPTFGAVSLTTDVSGVLPANNGGTGVANNVASTLTISGSFATTLTVSGTTGVTLPTTGTLATLAGSETFTNKTLTSPVLTTPQLGTPSQGVLSSCTVDGTNAVGYRSIPLSGSAKTTSYTLATGDVGELIQVNTGGSIIVPDATFATGDAVVIFNNTVGSITLTMSITTAYIGGTAVDVATITLAPVGVCNVLFISSTVCVVTGNVT